MLYGSVRPGEDDRADRRRLPTYRVTGPGRPVRVSWSARHHEPHRHHPTGPRPGRGRSAVDPARPLKRQAMSVNLKSPDIRELKPRITVFGVGGAGGNAINNMINAGL